MKNDLSVKVEKLGKAYNIGDQQSYHSLHDLFSKMLSKPLSFFQKRGGDASQKEVWALRDISFEVKQGEALGIVGMNGAGKTTLLRLLTRITEPTEGQAIIRGRVSSLLEVGTGFHPELTGRENIFVNAVLLGMSKAEVNQKLDDIIQFSGIEKFIDTPVKKYSSGMQLRLAFSVSAHLEPEIVLMDEVLAVGDAEFQDRCINKMKEMIADGRTVLYVSHDLPSVSNLCDRAILLKEGCLVAEGSAKEIVNHYLDNLETKFDEAERQEHFIEQSKSDAVKLVDVKVLQNGKNRTAIGVDISKPTTIKITYKILSKDLIVFPCFHLYEASGVLILSTADMTGIAQNNHTTTANKPHAKGIHSAELVFPENFFNDTSYFGTVILAEKIDTPILRFDSAIKFEVFDNGEMRKNYRGDWMGVVRPKLKWHTGPEQIS